MRKVFAVTAALALLGLGIAAQANVFDLGTGFTNLETVAVGDPGNTGELSGAGAGGHGLDRICGSVGYNYSIGKYEVTAKQYTDFLNAKAKTDPYGLYISYMADVSFYFGCNIQRSGGGTVGDPYSYTVADDWANRPVNFVSYWDSCRFANWLGNGQGDGDTETGAYTLNGYNGDDGRTIQRNAGATWAVTSEDEWYKAAYYKGGGTTAGYWDYPTSSNTAPGRDMADASGNNANYWIDGSGVYPIDSGKHTTVAGEFQNSDSPYGTFDQGGNVFEWTEAIVAQGVSGLDTYATRGTRGGNWGAPASNLRASFVSDTFPSDKAAFFGFRVSQVPEPSSILALAGGLVGVLGIRRRRA